MWVLLPSKKTISINGHLHLFWDRHEFFSFQNFHKLFSDVSTSCPFTDSNAFFSIGFWTVWIWTSKSSSQGINPWYLYAPNKDPASNIYVILFSSHVFLNTLINSKYNLYSVEVKAGANATSSPLNFPIEFQLYLSSLEKLREENSLTDNIGYRRSPVFGIL